MAEVSGTCDARFAPVRDALAQQLEHDELGASIVLDIDGETVVDIWGGWCDTERRRPWERDTITNVWSTTKTVTNLAALMLIDRGEVDAYAPVAEYWPEFAANGKEAIAVRHILSHTSGVSGWDAPFAVADMYDWTSSTERLAAQAPWWEPGTASGYHANNQGHLVGEIVRRVTGLPLKRFVAEQIAGPLGADFQIGAAERDWPRIAPVVPPPPLPIDLASLPPESPMYKTFTGPVADAANANTAAWRRADMGALNGHANARSVVRIIKALSLGGTVDGIATALARDDRPHLRRAEPRHRPGPGRAAALRHRLRAARDRDGALRAPGTLLLLGRMGWVGDHRRPGPARDLRIHDEQHGAGNHRVRPLRDLRPRRVRLPGLRTRLRHAVSSGAGHARCNICPTTYGNALVRRIMARQRDR